MNECQSISESAPVRQGDVFVSHPSGDGGKGAVHVVITADCDLAQGKSGPFVTWLPVVNAADFLRARWMDERLGELTAKLRGRVAAYANQAHLLRTPDGIPLAEDFVVEWLNEKGSDAVADSLGANDEVRRQMADAHAALGRVATTGSETPLNALVDLYFDLQLETGLSKSVTKARNRGNELKSLLKTAAQDTLFLSAIPGQSRIGWMVQLRHIRQVPHDRLKMERRSWFDDRDAALRVGRLAPVYKYALSQQFGNLFSKIGLPSEYEAWRGVVVDDLCAGLYPERI